jgi:hypothetical protein
MGNPQPFMARWKKVSLPNKLTVLCTLIIAVATVWYAVTAHAQLASLQKQLGLTQQALFDAQHNSAVATDQTWQAIGNINWMARTTADSLRQSQAATEAGLRQNRDALVISQRAYLFAGHPS